MTEYVDWSVVLGFHSVDILINKVDVATFQTPGHSFSLITIGRSSFQVFGGITLQLFEHRVTIPCGLVASFPSRYDSLRATSVSVVFRKLSSFSEYLC